MPKILNEVSELERLLNRKDLKGTQSELNLLAKHFRRLGKGEVGIMKSLIEYGINNFQYFNPILSREALKNAVRVAMKSEIKSLSDVYITKKEIEEIQTVPDFKIQQVLFAFLVYVKAANPDNQNGVFVNGLDKSAIRYILKMSGSRYSLKQFEDLTYYLFSTGLFDGRMSYKTLSYIYYLKYLDSETWKPKEYEIFIDGKERVIQKAGDIYRDYCGGILYECSNCGKLGVKKGKRQSRCEPCSSEFRRIVKKLEWKRKKMGDI